jgi:transcriptional regulator GlxA family with amidase domain
VEKYFEKIQLFSAENTMASRFGVFRNLYALAEKLFRSDSKSKNSIVDKAVVYMRKNYSKSDLGLKEIAQFCAVSEVYLIKLFKKHLGVSPFKMLTNIRMTRAEMMVEEKRTLTEVSTSVGYSDLYQFSRAYKKYFGYAPTMKNK